MLFIKEHLRRRKPTAQGRAVHAHNNVWRCSHGRRIVLLLLLLWVAGTIHEALVLDCSCWCRGPELPISAPQLPKPRYRWERQCIPLHAHLAGNCTLQFVARFGQRKQACR